MPRAAPGTTQFIWLMVMSGAVEPAYSVWSLSQYASIGRNSTVTSMPGFSASNPSSVFSNWAFQASPSP